MVETMEALRASIARDLARLLNTRSPVSMSQYEHAEGTVLEYGIPDFSHLSSRSSSDLEKLQAALCLALGRYETRLSDPLVKVSAPDDRSGTVRVQITASAQLGTEQCRFDFEMLHEALDHHGNTK